MPSKTSYPETFRDLKRIIVRHRWRFLIPSFVVTMSVLLIGLFLPRKYEGEAIFERRNDLVMSEIAGRGAPQSFVMLKRSLKEELSGVPAIEKVVDDLLLLENKNPNNKKPQHILALERQDLVTGIRKRIKVDYDISTPEVDRIRVEYTDPNPQRAQRIVNKLVENYIDRARRQVDQMLGQAAKFFEAQVNSYRDHIEVLEDKKLRFEITNAGLLPNDASDVQEALTEAENTLVDLERRHLSAGRRIEDLGRELKAAQTTEPDSVIISPNPEVRRIEQEMRQFQEKLDKAILIDKMTDQHPMVQGYRAKINDLMSKRAELPAETVQQKVFGNSTKRAQLELAIINATADRDALAEQITSQKAKIAMYKEKASHFFPVRAEYRKLERAIEEDQRQLNFWESNHRRVQMALTAELGQRGITMDFIKPAGMIQRPISPDLLQVLFAAVALGLAAGIGCVLFADRTDQTLRSLEQANSLLPVPILGAVAEIITRQQARWRRWTQRVFFPLLMAGFALLVLGAGYLNYLSLKQPYLLNQPTTQQTSDAPIGQSETDPPTIAEFTTEGT